MSAPASACVPAQALFHLQEPAELPVEEQLLLEFVTSVTPAELARGLALQRKLVESSPELSRASPAHSPRRPPDRVLRPRRESSDRLA